MTYTINKTVRCYYRGHKVEAARIPGGGFNLGIDGWLVGTAEDAASAIGQLTECLRMRNPHEPDPSLPQSFHDDVAALSIDR